MLTALLLILVVGLSVALVLALRSRPAGLRVSDDETPAIRTEAVELPDAGTNGPPVTDLVEVVGDADDALPAELLLEHPTDDGRHLHLRVLDPPDAALFARADADLPPTRSVPAAAHQALAAVPQLKDAVLGGKVVQILNPEVLKHGELVKTAGGNLGVIRDGKKFTAQLRLGEPKNLRTVAAPAAAWQIAGAITLQYYLVRINQQLRRVEGQVKAVRQDLRNKSFGKVMAAFDACHDLEEQLFSDWYLSENDLDRLVEEEGRIDEAYHELRKSVDDFRSDVDHLIDKSTSLEKGELRQGLTRVYDEATGVRLYDAQLLAIAAAVRHKLNMIRVMVERENGSGRAQLAEGRATREFEAMREELQATLKTFEKLKLTDAKKEKLAEKWWWGIPTDLEEELAEYGDRSKEVRSLLRTAPEKFLPPPEPVHPLLVEIAARDGQLVATHGVLEPAASRPQHEELERP